MSLNFKTFIQGNQTLYGQSSNAAAPRRMFQALGLSAWVFVAFILASISIGLVLPWWNSLQLLAGFSFDTLNPTLQNFIVAILVYTVTIVLVFGVSELIRRNSIRRASLGLHRLPRWTDLLAAPAGFIIYLVLSAALVAIVGFYFKGFDASQSQDTGFENLFGSAQYLLAFIALVVVAPIAEEVLMRGFLYGKLRKILSLWPAIVLTSLVFGALHGQWNVGIDVFALSVILCLLRETTGSIWAGILLHMLKNGIAYYFLFVNPLTLSML